MAEAIDIRELNIRIEQQSQFVTNLVMGMNKVIVGQKTSLTVSLSVFSLMVTFSWKVYRVWRRLLQSKHCHS